MGISFGKEKNLNVKFYSNELSLPEINLTFGEFCEFWQKDYDRLASNDFYIHWLFPTNDVGNNKKASPFTDEEIEIFKKNEIISHRLMTAFDLMLDFFGMIRKGNNFELALNAEERLIFLSANPKHYMKITRILKCFHILGMMDVWESWLLFLRQLIDTGYLQGAKKSYDGFWIHTNKN